MQAIVKVPFIVRDGDTDTVTERVEDGTIVRVIQYSDMCQIELPSGVVCYTGKSRISLIGDQV